MSKTQIEMDGLLDRGSITPMKSIPLAAQTTLQPGVISQYGSCAGVFRFTGFAPGGIVLMNLTPRYRVTISDIWVRTLGTSLAGAEDIIIEKVNTAGAALGITTIFFAGTLLEISRYQAGIAGAVNANLTIDPTINEAIRVRSAVGVTGGAVVTILFTLS